MNKPLRSLSGLIDFDCAARWGSFKLAAQELHKTPAAISLQVKQLEEVVGFALFIRHPRHITLTEKGQDLAVTVARLLADLRSKVEGLRGGDDEKILRITTTNSLAIKWLVPRIDRFTRLYPELDIRLDSSDRLIDMDDDSIDVAIRFSEVAADDPALLLCERLVPVYSPLLLAPGQQALTLADLQRFPLLHEKTTEPWIQLMRENNALKGRYDFSRSFTNFAVQVQAAVAGQGVGLVPYAVAYEDIQAGALRVLACRLVPYHRGYRFLVNRRKQQLNKIVRFRAWLIEEMAQMQRAFG
jgi:LysR family glycine cleavage system transcriptional activator